MVGVNQEENLLLSPINDSGELAEIAEIKVEFEDGSIDSKGDDNELEYEESKEAGLQVPETPVNQRLDSGVNEDNQINY